MEYEQGANLQLVIGNDISWAKEGDKLTFLRNEKNHDETKGLLVVTENGDKHFINEYRVATFGDEKAITKCIANAPKMYVVLQDSCRNVQGSQASVGIEDAEALATSVVGVGEPQTVYELKAVKKVSKEPIVTEVA